MAHDALASARDRLRAKVPLVCEGSSELWMRPALFRSHPASGKQKGRGHKKRRGWIKGGFLSCALRQSPAANDEKDDDARYNWWLRAAAQKPKKQRKEPCHNRLVLDPHQLRGWRQALHDRQPR